MNNKVKEFFIKQEELKLNRENEFVLLDDYNLDEESQSYMRKGRQLCYNKYKFDDMLAYTKTDAPYNLIWGIASSNMYNNIGLPAPHSFLAKRPDDDINYYLVSQDIHQLKEKGFDVLQADNSSLYKSKYLSNLHFEIDSRWSVFKNELIRKNLLQIMTEECYDQFIAMFLADELRTDNDRHWGNFFFYKEKDAEKWEGIIVFDLEMPRILNTSARGFKKFLKSKYYSWSPENYIDSGKNYKTRTQELLKVIDKGYLSNNQIQTMKAELQYDFPKEIKTLGSKYGLKKDTAYAYDMASLLWEYNQKNIGKALEL